MTVDEAIEILQEKDPKAEVILFFVRYTPTRLVTTATKPVNYPLHHVQTVGDDRRVFLVADQKGKYY